MSKHLILLDSPEGKQERAGMPVDPGYPAENRVDFPRASALSVQVVKLSSLDARTIRASLCGP
jgi:hypothetical protein